MSPTPNRHWIKRAIRRRYPRIKAVTHFSEERLGRAASSSPLSRYHVVFRNRSGGVEDLFMRGKRTDAAESSVLERYPKQGRSFRVPRFIAYDRRTQFLLYEELWGDTLRRFPFRERPKGAQRVLARVAECLAALHRMPPRRFLRLRADTEPSPEMAWRDLAQKHPAAARFLHPTAQPPIERSKRGFVHGDFQASNVLLTLPDGAPGLLDFSHAKIGDPMEDVATFFVHTRIMLLGLMPLRERDRALRTFLTRYRKSARIPEKILRVSLRAHAPFAFSLVVATTLNLVRRSHEDYPRLMALLRREHIALSRLR